jgi:arylsulfatase
MSSPNVLVILLDDVGFGASSAFGGPCRTPTAERLAARGLKYVRFHTTGLCSPTRAALLTGRNHHAVGFGAAPETATSARGYNSLRPNSCVPLPRLLRDTGYATAHFGKCHEVPVWHATAAGPFHYWPTGNGFQHFYGYIAAETNYWFPALWHNTTQVHPRETQRRDYHLTADLTDKAIAWLQRLREGARDRPFFIYFSPGATHAPHHVPRQWADKYTGLFDAGWDHVRAETFTRQKALDVIPRPCELPPRHAEIPAWNDMPERLKPVLRRQMEIYAGFLEYADYQVGRLIDAIERMELLDDTLVFYVLGDNGASAEGGLHGTFGEIPGSANGSPESPDFLVDRLDKLGGPEAYNHYAVGWAHAMCTPYKWTKQVSSHWGATRTGLIVHWPRGIAARGEMRTQFCHVTDLAPTILEALRLETPRAVRGVAQEPFHGCSLVYSFEEATAPERHATQYFEMFGNRGIYHRGWSAVAKHRTPWATGQHTDFDKDVWELYDGSSDWTQGHDLAAAMPVQLARLQRRFVADARRFHVFPLDDREVERLNPDVAGRPTLRRRLSEVIYPAHGRFTEACSVNILNSSHAVIAELALSRPANGVIVNQGGSAGGWALYMKNGRPFYSYNYGGRKRTLAAQAALPRGEHEVRVQFDYDGGGRGKGGWARMFVDGHLAGATRIPMTPGNSFWSTTQADRRSTKQTSSRHTRRAQDVTTARSAFTGVIRSVRIVLGAEAS